MSSNIVDAIASGSSPADITQEIKDILFAKSAERISDFRSVAANNMFGANQEAEAEAEETEGEWS